MGEGKGKFDRMSIQEILEHLELELLRETARKNAHCQRTASEMHEEIVGRVPTVDEMSEILRKAFNYE